MVSGHSEPPSGIWAWAPRLAVPLAAFLVLWPLVAGLTVAVDDVERLLTPVPSLGSGLRLAWQEALFRPAIVVSAFLVDDKSRAAEGVAWLQAAAFVLSLLPAWKLGQATRLGPWAVTFLWLLHPAVAVSLWQADTLSQTLSAGFGMALVALGVGAFRPRYRAAWWFGLVGLGLLSKETFLGWVPVALAVEWYRTRQFAKGSHGVAIGVVVVYLALRLPIALDHFATSQLGAQVIVRNVGVLGMGLLSLGPLHLLRLVPSLSWLWWLAAAGPVLHLTLLGLGVLASPGALLRVTQCWAGALLVLVPVLVMPHVSELYLMGPNFLTSLALAESCHAASKRFPRSASAGLIILFGAGLWGVASRSYHFALTWDYGRELARQIEPQAASPSRDRPDPACFGPPRGHGVYFVSPAVALCVPCSEAVREVRGTPLTQGWQANLDCSSLPRRRVW